MNNYCTIIDNLIFYQVLDHYENAENVAEAFEMTETDGSRVLPTTNNYMDLQRTVEFSSLTISVQ